MPQNPALAAVRLPGLNPITEKVKELQDSGPSVFEPTTHKLARWLANLVPTEGDVSELVNPLNAPAGVAVSAFMKAGGGGKLARQAATQSSIGSLVKTLTNMRVAPQEIETAKQFLEKYPRVAAHNSFPGISTESIGRSDAIGGAVAHPLKDPGHSLTLFSDRFGEGKGPWSFMRDTPPAPVNHVLAHEMTHGAQRVALKQNYQPIYDLAQKELGYGYNPLEQSARHVAEKHFPTNMGESLNYVVGKPADTRRGVQNIVDMLLKGVK